jgi:hypothetical protein
MSERLGWEALEPCRPPARVCPSNAHTAIVIAYPRRSRNLLINRACRQDCAATGSCWCGKLRQAPAVPRGGR